MKFLFDNQLIAAVETLIRESKHRLLLVSPYINFDARIKDALHEKLTRHDFELKILFGKNEGNYYRSIRTDSFEFLQQFPNIEIRYNERLHAKFYQNDTEFIMTSLNLYDYSLANNIEVGILVEYATPGMIGKALDFTTGVLDSGMNKVKHEVLGLHQGVDPIAKFQLIFNNAAPMYKTEPILSEKAGLQGFLGKKKLEGFKVLHNYFGRTTPVNPKPEAPLKVITKTVTTITQSVTTEIRCVSATHLAKKFNVPAKEIALLMESLGYIQAHQITATGKSKGLVVKNHMGTDYIAYPENLEAFRKFVR